MSHVPHIDMTQHHIENEVKSFWDKCFLKVGSNTIYSTLVLVRLLLEKRIAVDKPPPLTSRKVSSVLLSAS